MGTSAVAVLLALAASATALPPKGADNQAQVSRQKDIIRLLTHVNQPLLWEDLATVARDYNIQPENYKVPSVAEEFLQLELYGELPPRDLPVSVLDEHQVDYTKVFLDLLYFARDYDVFYKTALYLRDRVNKGLFLPAFFTAVTLRQDTQDVVLPPLYEVYPQLYFTSDVVQQVYDAKLQGLDRGSNPRVYILANYTGFPSSHTPDQQLSYFTEDVGLNEFFAQFFYRYPYFLSADNYTIQNGEARGDLFYNTLRQTFGRYVIERLANGLPVVEPVDYEGRVETGFSPRVRLQNGIEIPARPAGVKLRDVDPLTLQRIRNAEYRINEAVELGLAISKKEGRMRYEQAEATNIFGNLVQSTADSIHPRYYGALFRDLLSLFAKSSDVTHKYGVAASVLGKYETMARDPVYFQIVRRVLDNFQQYNDNLPPYTKQEIEFPGLKIEDAGVDKLVTYFENYDIEADNVIPESTGEEAARASFWIRQPRLSHKQYTYLIKVSSEKPVKAIFRIFLGPREDENGNELPIDVARQYFVEYDRFIYQVPAGQTEIRRSSRDSPVLSRDAPPTSQLLERLSSSSPAAPQRAYYGFPERLALPRGSRAGLPLRLYVIATPLGDRAPAAPASEWSVALGDGRPVGFPFDRRIPHYYSFRVPNAYMKDVVVFHKTVDEINQTSA